MLQHKRGFGQMYLSGFLTVAVQVCTKFTRNHQTRTFAESDLRHSLPTLYSAAKTGPMVSSIVHLGRNESEPIHGPAPIRSTFTEKFDKSINSSFRIIEAQRQNVRQRCEMILQQRPLLQPTETK